MPVLELKLIYSRLQYYDQNNNFGRHVVQEDEHAYSIATSEITTHKDINADTKVC